MARTYPLRFIHPKARGSFSLDKGGLNLQVSKKTYHFLKEDIQQLFCYRHVFFFQGLHKGKTCFFHAQSSKENMQCLKESFWPPQRGESCPSCGAVLLKGSIDYCACCYRMFDEGRSLNDQGVQYFNFCSDGFFGPCIPEQEDRHLKNIAHDTLSFIPLDDYLGPFFEKLFSHISYLFIWLFLSPLITYLPAYSSYLFFCLLFFHLFFIGAYATELMVYKAFSRKFARSPLKSFSQSWRGDFAKAGKEVEKSSFFKHPGLLVNVFLSDPSLGKKYLERAYELCPQHPFIFKLYKQVKHAQVAN